MHQNTQSMAQYIRNSQIHLREFEDVVANMKHGIQMCEKCQNNAAAPGSYLCTECEEEDE